MNGKRLETREKLFERLHEPSLKKVVNMQVKYLEIGLKKLENVAYTSVSKWAEKSVKLPAGMTPFPGLIDFDRSPYLRGMIDAFNDPQAKQITLMTSSQVGKSTSLLCILLWSIVNIPQSILFVTWRESDAEVFSKKLFWPAVEANEAIHKLFHFGNESKKRDQKTSIRSFTGGQVYFCSSGAEGDTKGKSAGVVILDEVSNWTNHNIVEDAIHRSNNYPDAKVVMASTPHYHGCPISTHYERGDQRKFFVPCPYCKDMAPLDF